MATKKKMYRPTIENFPKLSRFFFILFSPSFGEKEKLKQQPRTHDSSTTKIKTKHEKQTWKDSITLAMHIEFK